MKNYIVELLCYSVIIIMLTLEAISVASGPNVDYYTFLIRKYCHVLKTIKFLKIHRTFKCNIQL